MSIDYQKAYQHLESLQKLVLVTTGRAGIDFFQSLLDGHSKIIHIPGSLAVHLFWDKAICKDSLEDLATEFVWSQTDFSPHITKFKSRFNPQERLDKMGPNRDESFTVDIEKFKTHLIGLLKDKAITRGNFTLAVHGAYALASNQKLDQAKIVVFHLHHIDQIPHFAKDFQNFFTLCAIRNPRNLLVSGLEHWKKYNPRTFNAWHFYFLLNRILSESEGILKFKNPYRVARLEDVHLRPKEVFTDFCQIMGIEYESNFTQSTFMGKQWWGDAISPKFLAGFNPNIQNEKWKEHLSPRDSFLLEFLLLPKLKHHRYPIHSKLPSFLGGFVFPFAALLPMTYELRILAFNLWGPGARGQSRLKNLAKSAIFYFKRIQLFKFWYWKRITGDISLAPALGDLANQRSK